jgi:hypothetical protein
MNMMVRELTWEHTLAILPEVQKAEAEYWAMVSDVTDNDRYAAITSDFNALLDKAIEALWQDTNDRNSLSTLQQVFRARGKFDTHFGIQPTKAILHFMRYKQSDNDPTVFVPEKPASE